MVKKMDAKFAGKCTECGGYFPAGTRIGFNTETRKAAHVVCPAVPAPAPERPVVEKVPVDVMFAERDALREAAAALVAAGATDDALAVAAEAGKLADLLAEPVKRFDEVVVARGKKVPLGTTGVVIWIGTGRFGTRVGVKDADGTVHWTAATNVDVVARERPAALAA